MFRAVATTLNFTLALPLAGFLSTSSHSSSSQRCRVTRVPLSKPLFSLAVTVRRLPSSTSVAEAVNVTPRLSDLSDVAIAVDASAMVVPDEQRRRECGCGDGSETQSLEHSHIVTGAGLVWQANGRSSVREDEPPGELKRRPWPVRARAANGGGGGI